MGIELAIVMQCIWSIVLFCPPTECNYCFCFGDWLRNDKAHVGSKKETDSGVITVLSARVTIISEHILYSWLLPLSDRE